MTPEDLRDRLLKDLVARRQQIRVHYDYYRGDHPLPWAPSTIHDEYRAFLRMSRSNWCRLVVKASSERLRVVGVRFSGDGNTAGDTDVWRKYWQGNRLDAESRMVHDCALIARRGYALVWPNPDGGTPTITPEHPSQCIVEYMPGNRRKRIAALKTFADVRGRKAYATLWTAEAVYNWQAPLGSASSFGRWVPWTDDVQGIMPEAANPLGDVPIIEFLADPSLCDEPMSELDGGVIDIQDRINKTILDRLVTSNFSSFRQKWATGLEIPKDPDTGVEVEPFNTAVDRLFVNENEGGKFGSFDASDLAPYIASVEADIQHLAAITRTPPHYLLGQSGAFPSGQSLKATETGLVAKVLERTDSFTESWEDTLRLALRADGDPRADDMAMSMIWQDPESHSIAELNDAGVKQVTIGVPWRERMRKLGYSPVDIDRLEAERAEEIATGDFAAGPARITETVVAPGAPPSPAP